MQERIKLIECPRDAWQGMAAQIPSAVKASYLRRLIDAGFRHIDAVSFVSPRAVPQMADSERVLELLAPPRDVEIIGIVVNEKGADRAIATGSVQTLGFPYSVSSEFLRRNQHQSLEECVEALEAVAVKAEAAERNVVAFISMAFGNPYGETWSPEEVVNACDLLADLGVHQISLADTVGIASPERIAETVSAALATYPDLEIGVHLHARRGEAPARILAAYHAGCRRFDGALGGLGGCPFAQDELMGNIPTEILIETLQKENADLPPIASMRALLQESHSIARNNSADTPVSGSRP